MGLRRRRKRVQRTLLIRIRFLNRAIRLLKRHVNCFMRIYLILIKRRTRKGIVRHRRQLRRRRRMNIRNILILCPTAVRVLSDHLYITRRAIINTRKRMCRYVLIKRVLTINNARCLPATIFNISSSIASIVIDGVQRMLRRKFRVRVLFLSRDRRIFLTIGTLLNKFLRRRRMALRCHLFAAFVVCERTVRKDRR